MATLTKPQARARRHKRIRGKVVSGMAISASQPSSVRRAATSQMPSQLRFTLALIDPARVLPSPRTRVLL